MAGVHVVQYSTGMSSAEVAWRLVAAHGPGGVLLLTADTLKEDPDNWRFAAQVQARLGCEWVKLTDGRTPMQVGRDERCVPNNRWAVCSKYLKRKLLRAYLDARYDPAADEVHIGYDWSEPHRIADSRRFWDPWPVRAVLAEPPYAPPLGPLFRSRGIDPPALYAQGFAHANCGGACVRGGQAQWQLLLTVNRRRYLEWEADEEQSRALLGKDVTILRDRVGGPVIPLPLRTFRERIERQPSMFDADDWGACGCDMDGSADGPQGPPVRVYRVERWSGSGWDLVSEGREHLERKQHD